MFKVGDYIKDKQPDTYKELNKKRKRKHKKKERQPAEEHLSFYDIDKMMRTNRGIDPEKCKGR